MYSTQRAMAGITQKIIVATSPLYALQKRIVEKSDVNTVREIFNVKDVKDLKQYERFLMPIDVFI